VCLEEWWWAKFELNRKFPSLHTHTHTHIHVHVVAFCTKSICKKFFHKIEFFELHYPSLWVRVVGGCLDLPGWLGGLGGPDWVAGCT
jgi:hypothetical protein